ncbi:MAG: HAD family phosphatase [Clostridiales bacterium]|nr:HAD family phosphatase [Clostridiales bacterium]
MKETRIDFTNMKGAIFDMDGTLTDSMPLWKNIGHAYLVSQGITPKEDLFSALKTLTLEESAAYFQKEYGINKTVPEILAGANDLLRDAYGHTVPLKPGAKDLLKKMKQHGIPMCIATATDQELAEMALRRLGVIDYFQFILTCRTGEMSKRKPYIFYELPKMLGTDPEGTWVFEDALHAAKSAKTAGLNVLAVYDASSKRNEEELRELADVYVESLEELL